MNLKQVQIDVKANSTSTLEAIAMSKSDGQFGSISC